MYKKIMSIFLVMVFILSIPIVAVAQSVPSKPEPDAAQIAKGKEMAKKVASGEYELDLNTMTLVKVQDRTDRKATSITPNYTSGSNEKSHQWLATKAVQMLANDGYTGEANLIYSYFADYLAGADWPDIYENDGINPYVGHFYHYQYHYNYLLQSSPTAMTRFNSYISQANSSISMGGNNSYGVKLLGIALHYYADMNEPHHVTNKTVLNSFHSIYEDYIDTIKNSYVQSHGWLYGGTDYQAYAQAAANYAASYISYADAATPDGQPDYNKWDIAAANTLPYTQASMAAVTQAFLHAKGY